MGESPAAQLYFSQTAAHYHTPTHWYTLPFFTTCTDIRKTEVSRNFCLIVAFRQINFDKCKPISLSLSLSPFVSLCGCLASIQLLRNCVGEKLLAVQTGCNYRGLEADGHDPHSETLFCRYLSTCQPQPLWYTPTHTYPHRDTVCTLIHAHTEESAAVMFENQGVTEMNGFHRWNRWLQGNMSHSETCLKAMDRFFPLLCLLFCLSYDSFQAADSDSASGPCDLPLCCSCL